MNRKDWLCYIKHLLLTSAIVYALLIFITAEYNPLEWAPVFRFLLVLTSFVLSKFLYDDEIFGE